ncbi:MAG TPA: DUF547 domain-containing protein [Vicinamibacterales bacterium]|jgi:hypothetical protein
MRLLITLVAVSLIVSAPRAQTPSTAGGQAHALDQLLDLYVRGGDVYYRALKSDRGKLDGFINGIANVEIDKQPRAEQIAFWLNAYDAFVLRTVIDHYPIQGKAAAYPAKSIRQIPGAFEQSTHHAAGRAVTLDQIEQTILAEFHDPRVYFAIGRGAVGSGRLRSEAFVGDRIEQQLAEAAAECTGRAQCSQIDRSAEKVSVSSIFSWREKDFVASYAEKAPAGLSSRSPIERAVVAFILPNVLPMEKEMLTANTFQLSYKPFDWTLNDLTGRGGR